MTNSENKRVELFKKKSDQLKENGYMEKNATISMMYVYSVGLLLTLPGCALFFYLFYVLNSEVDLEHYGIKWIIATGICFLLMFVHEFIHGISWSHFSGKGFKTISFGFDAKKMCPYCTCSDPLEIKEYVIGALLPTIALGIIPCALSLLLGSDILLFVGILMYAGGAGDIAVIFNLLTKRKNIKGAICMDHPQKVGLVMFYKKENV